MDDVAFLDVDQVIELHEEAMAKFGGGLGGVKDHGLLDAAVAMPMAAYGGQYLHEDIAAMASAYLFHVTKAHAFNDGNKRTACVAMLVFLTANGVTADIKQQELEDMAVAIAAGQRSKEDATVWLRRCLS